MIPDQLSTLGHPQRLAVFRLLMRRYPDHVPAGELGAALGIKPSTLSSYLAALVRAGFVAQTRDGTSLLYSIDMPAVQRLFETLLNDCCRGRPELCGPFRSDDALRDRRKFSVLFLCTGNSARSIFAEVLLRDLGGDRFFAASAGTHPATEPNPIALKLLRDKGHDISGLRSKHVSELSWPGTRPFDFVFTVCNQAANEDCPVCEGQPVSGHWGMPDPVGVSGTEAERALAFQQSYGALRHRIEAFAALPVETLDRIAMQQAVDEIGRTLPEIPA